MPSFFSNIDTYWKKYDSLRNKYSNLIPIPNPTYFQPIRDMMVFTNTLVRPIHSPLWLGVNALLFFLKSFIYLAASLLLIVPTLLFAIFSPKSDACSAFKSAAAHTVVDATMGIIATCASLASLIFNPIYLLTRCLSTVVDHLNELTESCCNLTIAKF
ncbi:hypothetical protein OQJ18_00705 [Fluoribacter dumoffii]|uniref:Uncharacterized protein n=1 Tax=Fluoribacter dumoffii TaxID=463 RepID=A0A377GCS8_9GAMM|nr:hypothetical protein [Fluoribacter dumoffii]KTC90631.1 hypothetical protein Ldum_1699 [Fluoribacter dumoffii NY 23]MCW8386310.1 hypothetical protein [Fluoribacter dumoffii]MCW8419363.1 hypothetical protein [Fluoribacter dumoffii]MCW8452762.1 hypothetical protein [Fluoribacter dumoffii]MCW8459988.1 hypothetical protein [Fluoribacter dumoffii]